MGTKTQALMMPPPPEARAIPTDQSWLSESDPVSRTELFNPNRNDPDRVKESGGFTDTLVRRYIQELESPVETTRRFAQQQLQSEDAFNSIFAAVRTGKISQTEFLKLAASLNQRDPQVQE